MKRLRLHDRERRRGAALVEMALVLPIFVSVVLGIVEFGRAMMVAQLLTNASREGARMGAMDATTNTEVIDSVKDFVSRSAGVNASHVSVSITVEPAAGNPNPSGQVANARTRDLVTVQVQVPFDRVSYVTGNWLNGRSLTAQTSMRHE